MNKKLIKTIATITCGLGIASSIPFVITSCGSPKLVIEQKIENIDWGIGVPISTPDISQDVRIDSPSGEKVPSELLTFSISPELPSGLMFNDDTGVISGKLEEDFKKSTYKIKVSAIVDDLILTGSSNKFTIIFGDKFIPDGELSESDFTKNYTALDGISNEGKIKLKNFNAEGYNAIKLPNIQNVGTYSIHTDDWKDLFYTTLEFSENFTIYGREERRSTKPVFPSTLKKIIFDGSRIEFGSGNANDNNTFQQAVNVNTLDFRVFQNVGELIIHGQNGLQYLGQNIPDGTGKIIFKDGLSQDAKTAIFNTLKTKGLLEVKWSIK